MLFIAVRYLSVAALTVGGVGFFGSFSHDACIRFHPVIPIMKSTPLLARFQMHVELQRSGRQSGITSHPRHTVRSISVTVEATH